MTNELLINRIKEWSGKDPAKAQWISAALGATVNESTGHNVQTGADMAQSETKWNASAYPWPVIAAIAEPESIGIIAGMNPIITGFSLSLLGGYEAKDQTFNTDTSSWGLAAYVLASGEINDNNAWKYSISSLSEENNLRWQYQSNIFTQNRSGDLGHIYVTTPEVAVEEQKINNDRNLKIVKNIDGGSSYISSTPASPRNNGPKKNLGLLIIGAGITTQPNHVDIKPSDNLSYQYFDALAKESMVSVSDIALVHLLSTPYGIIGGIDDINTVRGDVHQYKFPYNYLIALGEISISNGVGYGVGSYDLLHERNPLPDMVIAKSATAIALSKIKEKYLAKLEKNNSKDDSEDIKKNEHP